MSDETDSGGKPIIVGGKVFVKDKNVEGVVRFVGTTDFAPGKWIGIQLAQPTGKNNGSVQGKAYFSCPNNCGLFVRQNQIMMLENVPGAASMHSFIPKPDSKIPMPSMTKRSPRGSPVMIRKSPNMAGDATTITTPAGGKPQTRSVVPQSKSQPMLSAKEPMKEVVRYCYDQNTEIE